MVTKIVHIIHYVAQNVADMHEQLPALLTHTWNQTSPDFSPIIGVPAVIRHNLSLIRKYHGFLFPECLPETFALNRNLCDH